MISFFIIVPSISIEFRFNRFNSISFCSFFSFSFYSHFLCSDSISKAHLKELGVQLRKAKSKSMKFHRVLSIQIEWIEAITTTEAAVIAVGETIRGFTCAQFSFEFGCLGSLSVIAFINTLKTWKSIMAGNNVEEFQRFFPMLLLHFSSKQTRFSCGPVFYRRLTVSMSFSCEFAVCVRVYLWVDVL